MMALPLTIPLGVGLVIVGLIRNRFGAAVFGVALLVLVGGTMNSSATAIAGNSAAIPTEESTMSSYMPLAVGFALLILFVAAHPQIVRATRGSAGREPARRAHWR